MSPITIREVARAAGVSVATVSHVVNGTRYVSPELTARVRSTAEELGYTPNGTARSLRLRRTQTIGLIVPDVNSFFGELARVIEDLGFAAGYTTVLGNADNHPERESRYVEVLVAKQVDGLILASTLHDASALGRLFGAAGTPVVVVDREVDLSGVDTVLADNRGGAYAATRHLLELGHTRVACLGGGPDLAPSVEREAGYRTALAEAGIEPRAEWVAYGQFQYAGGREAMRRVLEADPRCTAVFATNDMMALGALAELAARGLDVPGDVSLCGFDDVFPAEIVGPGLTTVRQPLAELGRAAVEMLIERMDADGAEPARREFATTLVVRGSTGPVPAGAR